MYANSNLVVSAWDGDNLVGISRSLTDFCYCCYLSDLAVKKVYQKMGIGKKLVAVTKEKNWSGYYAFIIIRSNGYGLLY